MPQFPVATCGPWFSSPRPVDGASIRLFCLPHAGGSAVAYHRWAQLLPDSIEMVGVHLPGRTYRLKESPFTRMAPLVEALTDAIAPHLERPFAIFGHSMGALVAFEMARRLRFTGLPAPVQLIVSGRRAPKILSRLPDLHRMPEDDFRQALHNLFGMRLNHLEDESLMSMSQQALRADLEALETWDYTQEAPLETPIAAIGGCSDPTLSYTDLEAWREETSVSFRTRWFPGGHFHLLDHEALVVGYVAEVLGGEKIATA